MNKRQKEVLQSQLDSEAKTLKELKQVYKKAQEDVLANIKALEARTDVENLQSIVYQKQYQEALKKQIDGILDVMNTEQFTTISDYLLKCYEEGYVGVMYDIHGQGIPLIMPINQEQVVEAIQTDSNLSEGLYKRLGVDTKVLKDSIRANVSRGIAASQSWADVARNIENRMNIGLNRSVRIARTEGHRILSKSSFDAQKAAKEKGADIVKQWDAALDKRTRPHHAQLDGQIREIDEPFEIAGRKAMFPGDFGVAAEDVNCRCAVLQRAKWNLDEEELQTLKDRAAYFGLDKTDSFEDFKKKYLDASKNVIYNGAGSVFDKFDRKASIITPEEDLAKVNLNFSTGEYQWTNNCQRCVPTYEMRRRGFNVIARPITTSISNDALANNYAVAWTNQDRIWCMKGSGLQQIKDQMSAWGDGARAEVFVSWSGDLGGSTGHVFVAEQMNGNTVFFDPQSGDSNCVRYFKLAAKGKTNILRIDNNTPSDYILDCCKNVGE